MKRYIIGTADVPSAYICYGWFFMGRSRRKKTKRRDGHEWIIRVIGVVLALSGTALIITFVPLFVWYIALGILAVLLIITLINPFNH